MAKAKYYLLTSDFIDGARGRAHRPGVEGVARRRGASGGIGDCRAIGARPTRGDPADQAGAQPLAAPGAAQLRGVAGLRDAQLPRSRGRRGHRRAARKRRPEFPRRRPMATATSPPTWRSPSSSPTSPIAITLPYYEQRSFNLDWKANRTEVTEADRETESAICTRSLSQRPDDGLFGEEHGLVGNADSPWRWIIDPIDGTSQLRPRHPGVGDADRADPRRAGPVVGVVSAPALGRRWWAASGARGVRRRPAVPGVDRRSARRGPGQRHVLRRLGRAGLTARLVALQQAAYRARGFGDFWQHMLVAEGAIDLADRRHRPGAVRPRRRDGGGRGGRGTFTDRHGERTYLNDSAVSSNGLLHASHRRPAHRPPPSV